MPTIDAVRNSYLEQARLSQGHRWLAACCSEPPGTALEDLFVPEVSIDVSANVTRERSPKDAAHLPKFSHLEVLSARSSGDAQAVFDLVGVQILPNPAGSGGAQQVTAELGFSAKSQLQPGVGNVTLRNGGARPRNAGYAALQEASGQHQASRILSLKHRWHALVESPQKYPDLFQEIIADDFVMDWGSGSVCGYAELAPWVHKSGKLFAAARHEITAFDWRSTDVGRYQVQFRFDWFGLDHNGRPMVARSEHEWRVMDNPAARFPRIAAMNVNLTEPFRAASKEEFNV